MMNQVNGVPGKGNAFGPAGNKPTDREKPAGGIKTAAKTDKFEQIGGTRLSEKAQKLLKELQLKYRDTDFVIADYSSDEEANHLLAGGKKEYSVLIDPDTLEKMAADESTRDKYIGMIDESRAQISTVMNELSANGKSAKMVGATVSDDGTMQMFAELEEMTERRNEQMEKAREAAKEERAEEKKKAEKPDGPDKPGKPGKPGEPGKPEPPAPGHGKEHGIRKITRFIADSAESLLKSIFSFFGIEPKKAEKPEEPVQPPKPDKPDKPGKPGKPE